jgi:hypothetical protein
MNILPQENKKNYEQTTASWGIFLLKAPRLLGRFILYISLAAKASSVYILWQQDPKLLCSGNVCCAFNGLTKMKYWTSDSNTRCAWQMIKTTIQYLAGSGASVLQSLVQGL